MEETPRTLLAVSGVGKRFGGVQALDDVSIEFRAGEVHALLGENGAGKSTLVKIIAGVLEQDTGSVDSVGGATGDADDIAMVFQECSLIPTLSVRDNLVLALHRGGAILRRSTLEAAMRSALSRAGLDGLDLDVPVEVLPLAQQQLLEIARGLAADSRTLILDEPTATLSDVEIAKVHEVVRSLRDSGHAIVYITHRLAEVFALSDRITVMRSGRVVSSGRTSEFAMDSLVADMLGPEHRIPAPGAAPVGGGPAPDGPRLIVEGASIEHRLHGVSFEAPAGEVTAVFGQIGSGADDLVRALAGLVPLSSGIVRLGERTLTGFDRAGSQRHRVAYVSADRVVEGVFLTGDVVRNISSGALRRVSRGGVIRAAAERVLARDTATRVAFDPDRIHTQIGQLSGGNQQKIAIARALATEPVMLVLSEPTRGVDIGARAEIYAALRDLAATGVVVVVYSSDIVEIRELADRVLTLFRGCQVGDHRVDDTDDARILADILHGAAA
ncbi:sugar ABC transporter ATP-binding protein [Prauserella cavernicola]|uniref:Sugar ABC transporter ATP-binding protein n=1 Tax=Prauserella cavernicola TaxID=2800127 RepID=A0A934QS17_9PSEU|nr:sugar ABC transporter ATP-binding protein [Prauserella cavernicola]MBK1787177.1 sugar ABC transporter ATP-binding protein [Prauserella cavernicola]